MAFDHDDPQATGNIHWAITVSVIGYDAEEDARIAAQSVVSRQHYRLRRVWECPACGFQGRMAQVMGDIAAKM